MLTGFALAKPLAAQYICVFYSSSEPARVLLFPVHFTLLFALFTSVFEREDP